MPIGPLANLWDHRWQAAQGPPVRVRHPHHAGQVYDAVVAALLTVARARALTPWRSRSFPWRRVPCALGWDKTIDPPEDRSPR